MKRKRREAKLGMHETTAMSRLKKILFFNMIKKLNLDTCYRCDKKIEDISELSVDHKVPYLDAEDPVKVFFDLDNIAFSHFICNSKAARKPKRSEHPSFSHYSNHGCRCEECKKLGSLYYKIKRERLKNKKINSNSN